MKTTRLSAGMVVLLAIAGCGGSGSDSGKSSSASTAATPVGTGTTATTTTTATGAIGTAPTIAGGRALHSATLLASGEVFVAGGVDATGAPSAATYLLTTTTIQAGPSLHTARVGHAAAVLMNGNVLLVGGATAAAGTGVLATTEIYDPVANTMVIGPSLATPRAEAIAVDFGSTGAESVLVAGGTDGTNPALATAEILNVQTNMFAPAANPMVQPHVAAGAAHMDDGTIVIVGGLNATGTAAGAEVFSPTAMTFASAAMTTARSGASFAANGGDALVAGGISANGVESTTEGYSISTLSFAPGPALTAATSDAAAASLASLNQVAIVGGRDGTALVPTIEFALDTSSVWTINATSSLTTARYAHTATAMPNGHVLVIGGFNSSNLALTTCEGHQPRERDHDHGGGFDRGRLDHVHLDVGWPRQPARRSSAARVARPARSPACSPRSSAAAAAAAARPARRRYVAPVVAPRRRVVDALELEQQQQRPDVDPHRPPLVAPRWVVLHGDLEQRWYRQPALLAVRRPRWRHDGLDLG